MPLTRLKLTAIADGGITTDELLDGTVATVDVADSAVTTAKINDGAVTSAKLDTNIDIAGTLDVTGVTTLDSNVFVGGTNSVSYPTLDRGVYLQSQTDNDVIGYSLRVTDGVNNRRGSFFLDDTNGVYGMDITATTSVPDFVVNRSGTEIIRVSSNGLSFNGDTAAVNALDDYEEGTFTIELQAGGSDWYGPITHQYIKIGNAVFITGDPGGSLTSVTSATGVITVKSGTTLPFVPNHWGTISWVGNMRSIDSTDVQQGPHLRFGPGSASNISIGTQDGSYSGSGSWLTGYSVNSSATQTAHYSFFQGVFFTNS